MTAQSGFKPLVLHGAHWLPEQSIYDEVAISSILSLSRSLEGMNYPAHSNSNMLESAAEQILDAWNAVPLPQYNFQQFRVVKLNDLEKQLLQDHQLVSGKILNTPAGRYLSIGTRERLMLEVNGEDHIRIQGNAPGLGLHEIWKVMNPVDNAMGSRLPYAFHQKYGFLTASPKNAGTGMHLSVLLHLPALVLNRQIKEFQAAVNALGLICTRFSENTDEPDNSNLFRISNSSTVGESEETLIARFEKNITVIVQRELLERRKLRSENPQTLLDSAGRAYGLLRYAYQISYEEAFSAFSRFRLGIDSGLFHNYTPDFLRTLEQSCLPSMLSFAAGKKLSGEELNLRRASLIRQAMESHTVPERIFADDREN